LAATQHVMSKLSKVLEAGAASIGGTGAGPAGRGGPAVRRDWPDEAPGGAGYARPARDSVRTALTRRFRRSQ
jgi:hypothetical protein